MRLIIASQNKGKLKEISCALATVGIEAVAMDSFGDLVPAIEDGETLEENAIKKAKAVVQQTGLPCLADDSGLMVDALNGRPGVYSARYAGEDASYADNNELLLRELKEFPPEKRQAAFCCVMALCYPDGKCQLFTGKLEGVILEQFQGNDGFGYDPLFAVGGQQRSLAQMSVAEKNEISHRGLALQKLLNHFI
ncbi:MAG: non-canonical purine NTP pyrophosphatase [Desulfobacteraceae bacterium 4572_35.1]|nr:MAG: non-canonical purine NTP pyrophosphatase [Desulfobacteraceae bacterium 4572_35.1]